MSDELPSSTPVLRRQGRAALRMVVENGDLSMIRTLVEEGEDVDMVLLLASEKGSLRVVKYLIEQLGVYVDRQAMWRAASHGHLPVVRYFIEEHNVDPHSMNELALRGSVQQGCLNVVRYLVEEHKADIHIDDDKPLRLAVQGGHVDIVHYLIELGANIHHEELLSLALEEGHSDVIDLLLLYGADPTVLVRDEHTHPLVRRWLKQEQVIHDILDGLHETYNVDLPTDLVIEILRYRGSIGINC